MIKKMLNIIKPNPKSPVDKDKIQQMVSTLYKENEYLEAYSKHTDYRVELNPQEAVGGQWEIIGQLQFEFLVKRGLSPNHTMLDIGCGTLRGGRHFIKYLNISNYYGMDISPKAIEYAKQLVINEELSEKKPRIILNKGKNLLFREFTNNKFDYLLAQSVFTHLKPEHIKECFGNIGSVMHNESIFYFTYNMGNNYLQISEENY